MKFKSTIFLLASLIAMVVLTTACNLANNNEPPTLVPRVTETTFPTISYVTLAPEQMPQQQHQLLGQANPQSAKAAMNALLDQVDSDHLFLNVSALESMGTRHLNSPNSPNSGAAASYRYVRAQFDEIAAKSSGRFSVVDQPFNVSWAGVDTVQRNIIGMISGSVTGGGIILLGAHYDSISIDPNDPTYPGSRC